MTTVAEPAPAAVGEPGWTTRPALWLRLALVLACVSYALLVCALGQQHRTYGDLRAAVSTGAVSEVWATPGLRQDARGEAVVRLTWRDGLVADTTQVRERVGSSAVSTGTGQDDRVTDVVPERVVDELRSLDPHLVIHTDEWSGNAESAGFDLPAWMAWVSFGIGFAVLVSVRRSPWSWRATRWAWCWLVLSGPIGAAAYLLLSGPLPGTTWPGPGGRRLTGGWAFLLALVLGNVWGW